MRLPLITVALIVVAEIVVGGVAYALVRSTLITQVDARLEDATDSLRARDIETPGPGQRLLLAELPSDYVVMYHGPRGTLLSTVSSEVRGLSDAPEFEILTESPEPYTATDARDGSDWRLVTQPLSRGGRTVTVALPLNDATEASRSLLLSLAVVAAATAAVGAGIAWGSTRRSLRPLREAEETAAAIAGGDFTRRVIEPPDGTEAGSLARSLNAMLDRLSEAFASQRASEEKLRAFVADASHELRTPLAAIRGYAELHRLGGAEPAVESMNRIESNAVRMGALVEDLLTLARYDEAPSSLAGSERVLLPSLAEEAAADARAQAPNRIITLTIPPPPGPAVLGSPRHLRQVLANVVGNALRHTPEGSPLELSVVTEPGFATITVRDHGPGIPEAAREAVFGRFHRLDSSRARESGGTGLGLAIVRAIMDAHGGTATVRSPAGGGAAIDLRLPLAPE